MDWKLDQSMMICESVLAIVCYDTSVASNITNFIPQVKKTANQLISHLIQ